ncbi:YciI family protein [Jatrophihabitans telluris]|uniref:YciI family protein n=1 Tax=Jatrophihabitans telluris TaxID=2038343 RepID=A0ABY4QZS7_9ACTN|nr:YciI family protein [Jatrophihabitans telluris]UQX88425.1 YciI family protein [Jatrophihabitans telluris]
MRYLMFVATDPDNDADPTGEGTMPIEDWCDTYDAAGVRIMGERTRPAQDATTVRRRQGKVLVTDGPFAESREWIVGFDILECADLDEAIDVASRHPMAAQGRLELRPFWPFEDAAEEAT